jgi:hypothetical protein
MHIGFANVYDIKPHDRMKQERDIYKGYFNDEEEGNIVDRINAELVGPYSHSAKGVDANMNNQKSSNGYDSGEGVEL